MGETPSVYDKLMYAHPKSYSKVYYKAQWLQVGLMKALFAIHLNSRYIGHVAARAHLGPCERPKGRNNEILRKGSPDPTIS